ncbi:S8 family serine peptidase [Spirosoma validum]|uniref:S8 family serine peptidase n=1 Tax=Spirosoma validum TaxID=2771355 RepID=A0A927B4I3_9BACT|nr:S8 family serine peptidase [Spirosoma validum]MBD2755494.1 S8 family serine peptidase [Spirosoma validum]
MTNFYAFFSSSLRFILLGLWPLLTGLPINSQAQNKADQSIYGQYIVVYKKDASVLGEVKSIQTYQQRQQVMQQVAAATLLRNGLAGKPVLHVYDKALLGFAVSSLTPAEVRQLRQDDQVAYIVADQPVFLDNHGAPSMLASSCNGPSITLNGVTNYNVGLASFGSATIVTGQVVLVNDGISPTTDGCSAIQNNISGKIALIDRGTCGFSEKAYSAQQAGAIGVIIANNVAGTAPSMSGSTNANLVTIPVMSLSLPDGNALKTALTTGTVTATLDKILPTASSQCKPWGISRVGGGLSGVGKRAWIIDTGIDFTHPDLNVNTALSAYFIGTSPVDGNGHGTHVAGTIAAKDNGIGVIGVAAGAEVVAVRVFPDQGGSTTSVIIAGINYVTAHAASGDVVNMSLGGDPDPAKEEAVLALSGVCNVVLSAGNDAKNANFSSPARVNGPNIFTVSAMDINGQLASFSNFGNGAVNGPVDYSAPGVNVASCWLNGGYAYLNGTSMAAPHVAGLLLLGRICATSKVTGDPDGNPDLIATLYNPASDIDNDRDGVTACGGDCDDNDPAVHPGAVEICDGKDNNCNGQIDEGNVCCPAGNAGKLYVNASATGANNGLSWANAFTSLQAAITSAKRCSQITQIWVAKGTYYPTVDALGNASPLDVRTKAFSLKNGLAIYGGFVGNEAPNYNVSQRNLVANQTTLSGNIQQDNVATNNAYNVILNMPVFGDSLNNTAVLDGFTVRGGYGNLLVSNYLSFPAAYGGGMFNYTSAPTIRNNQFVENVAYVGGGVANILSDPIVTNCSFMGNGGTICSSGGGIDNTSSSPVLINCSFSGNRATSAGGMYISDGPSTIIRNVIFWGNSTELDGDLANATINYSIIQGGWSGAGTGNLSLDPKFVSQPAVGQSTGNLALTASSPAINGGSPSTTSATVGITDLASNPRFYNNGQIDIGAYEYQGISTIPDLTITTYARPTTLYGTNNISVVVDVVELVGTPTSGTVVVRLTKDSRVRLDFPSTATTVNNRSVQNSVWSFDGTSNASYYILTTTAGIPAGDKLSFGFTGVLTPGATTGIVTLSSVIVGGSGQEIRLTNNSDADKLDYFQQ